MFHRLINPLKTQSFFLFGARGTGKSTFVRSYLSKNSLYLDLLKDEVYDQLLTDKKFLERQCEQGKYEWIILDEVQRLPRLLNLCQRMIVEKGQKFALTGSSGRKIKRGAGNLLAGRAFLNVMHPLTILELGKEFDLIDTLSWGSLPKIFSLTSAEEKRAYLRSYYYTYIKEEIAAEQVVRKLDPFREFLGVAAQMSGKILNFSPIAREVGVDVKTVQNYYQILSDTYLGFFLPHFHRSLRKSQIEAPKFYLFDLGVKRALEGALEVKVTPSNSIYGDLFEALVILETFRINEYRELDFRLSYFRTKSGFEIDLILSKPGKVFGIEIKSSNKVRASDVETFSKKVQDLPGISRFFWISDDPQDQNIAGIRCIHFRDFLSLLEKKRI